MQAIETKYLPATNYRGSRVKASAQAGSVTVLWDDALSVEANHDAAARALILKWGWFGTWVRGERVDGNGNGNVYVCAKREGSPGIPSYRTPHPQAVNPLDVIFVRSDK